ncbi:MAG: efflux RND transporter periplasmic adaptor subunit [Luteolibacter sp.]
MKRKLVIAIVLSAIVGWFAARVSQGEYEVGKSRKVLYYQSPMHPWVKSDKPGECTVCGMSLVPIYEGGKNFDSEAGDVVMLPEGSPYVVGVKTEEVRKRSLMRTLRVSGMIGEDESRHGIISTPVEGRIDGLAMNHEGQQVTRRQPLATIFSRTLLAAANDYRLALDHDEVAAATAKKKLEQYGLVWEQIKAIPQRQPDDLYFGILAQLSGTIVKTYIAEGQYVAEGDRLFEIADFTKMWLMFPVYEQDLPSIQLGQVVSVRIPTLPGRIFKVRIAFISPNLDEATRSARVRVVLENPDRLIKNKTFAEGVIEIEAPEVLAVPRKAVLCTGDDPCVYVARQEGAYEHRRVKLGRVGDQDWEVLGGLKEGERVVTSGSMLIDGQAQLNSLANPSEP